MTSYHFDMQLVVDPFSTSNVVTNGQVFIYDPSDTANASPLELTDPNGLALVNPLMSNSNGFLPSFQSTSPQVKWASAGFVGYFNSYLGLRDEAQAAALSAAESAASASSAVAAVASSAAAAEASMLAAVAAQAAAEQAVETGLPTVMDGGLP